MEQKLSEKNSNFFFILQLLINLRPKRYQYFHALFKKKSIFQKSMYFCYSLFLVIRKIPVTNIY